MLSRYPQRVILRDICLSELAYRNILLGEDEVLCADIQVSIEPEQGRVLRPRPWLVAGAALAATVFTFVAVSAYRGSGWG